MAKDKKPSLKVAGRLVEIGHDEDLEMTCLKIQVSGSEYPVAIPTTQKTARDMALYLYEKVTITVEVM